MRNLKLHHILVVGFTLISAVPVLFLATWVQRSALEKELAAVEEKHLLIARNLGGALSRYAKDVESGFRLAVVNLSKGRKVDGLEKLLASLHFEHVCIVDGQGIVEKFITVSPAFNMPRIPEKLLQALQPFRDKAARNPGKVFFSDLLPDDKGRPRIFLLKGLPEGKIAIGAITTDYFVAVQQAITFGKKGHAAIVDRKGRVMAHPNPEWRRQMRDISAVEPVRRMIAGETGVTRFYSPATKTEMIAGFTTVPGVGWGAMIPQPYGELEDRAKDVRLQALAIALGGIIVAALISWWLARFLAAPIQAVIKSAREIAGGDAIPSVQVEPRFAPKELRELSESFYQMVSQVSAETEKTANMIARRNEVVERLAGGASLETVLRLLVENTQDLNSGMLGSVLLLDREKKRLLHGAAPNLPDFYNDAIDGLEIGPTAGSCGAAAHGGNRVVVVDVMTHPNWAPFRDLAKRAGLRACWSEPIKAASGEILGTFAVYYREPREPNEMELKRIVDAANLAGIAITRARTEEALMASEGQYRAIVENQTEWICRFLPNGKFTFANDAYCRNHDTTREELIGADAVFPGSGNRTLERLLANLGPEQPVQTSEQYLTGPDGGVVWQQWTDHALFDAQGKIVEIQSVGHDITGRRQAEEKLRQSRDQLRLITDNLPVLILYVDRDERYVFINRTAQHWFNKSTGFLLGKTVRENLGEIEYNKVEPFIQKALAGQEVRFEPHLKYADGAERTIDLLFVPDVESSGEVKGYFALGRDITEFKSLEHRLRQSQKMEALGTLTGGIAHDFNNILAPILGFSEILLEKADPSTKDHKNLNSIFRSAIRAKDLVSQIMLFSRPGESIKVNCDLRTVAREIVGLLHSSFPKSISIRANISRNPGIAFCDPSQVYQVLLNLCLNAEKALDEAGEVTISLSPADLDGIPDFMGNILSGKYVRLAVSDNGIGMGTDILPYIFDPFFTKREVGEGTGLGLSTVFGIVKTHDGGIVVTSQPGHGSTFEIFFPRIEDPPERTIYSPGAVPTGDETILFVDDEEEIIILAKETLEGRGYRVMAFSDPIEALESFKAGPGRFDLVLTDQSMPRMKGEWLVRDIRKINTEIPIILCTGYSKTISPESGAAIGIDKFMYKPIGPNDLCRVVREVLDAAPR